MSVLSLSERSDAPSEESLDKLSELLKDFHPISLLGRIDFDAADRIKTGDLAQSDPPKCPNMTRAHAPGSIKVPPTAEKVAYLFVPADIPESVLGDLEGIYHTTIAPKFGSRYANNWYRWRVSCLVLDSPRLRKLLLWGGGLVCLKKILDWISNLFGP
jgi:hypothetical protein